MKMFWFAALLNDNEHKMFSATGFQMNEVTSQGEIYASAQLIQVNTDHEFSEAKKFMQICNITSN